MNNPVNWFEIATKDLERAKKFYATVFNREFQLIEMPEIRMYMFAGGPDLKGALGALVSSAQQEPSTQGTLIYFECEDVANEAARVEEAGGQLLFPKTAIGAFGFIAQFIDSEGNRIGLHSHQ
ncbi:MAG: VOC family protein [Bacteroidetes bacterium]|nr:MAG: VOC family protein [Bacteroidota bacterium]